MKIAVCDDCREDAVGLANLLEGYDVKIYSSAESVLADVQRGITEFDLYLVDIYINNSMNGIELAGLIRRYDEEAVICFISGSDDFYREAYDLYAVQYLLKPVSKEDIRKLLERVDKHNARNKGQCLVYKGHNMAGSIPYGKIRYISSNAHTISIHCTDGSVKEQTGKLIEIANKICGEIFCRCHQSFIANMYQVESMSGRDLVIAGELIPVSRRYFAEVKRRYQEILFEEVD